METAVLETTAGARTDEATMQAAYRFLDLIERRFPVREAFLFGSRARGTHRPDSDADIAVVLRGDVGSRGATLIEMAGLAYEVMLDLDVHIQVTPLWKGGFDRAETCSNPILVRNIHRDGIRL